MDDYALVLNAGSSSLKFSVFHRPDGAGWRVDIRGAVDGIGTRPRLTASHSDGTAAAGEPASGATSVPGTLDAVASWLRARYGRARVLGVGHRVVHGGARFNGPVIVTPAIVEELRALVPLAPLHQPFNLAAIETVAERMPEVPQVACFDTSFHRTKPAVAEVVPLPNDLGAGGVRRYGFHGLSYEYIASVLPTVAPDIADRRVIVAHLGSGASLCALNGRTCMDTTLGFTALDGLCMGTRPGAVDPGVILYLFQSLGLSAAEVETVLYKKSGLLGISGVSNDMRVLLERDEPQARLAVDYFIYQAAKSIGAMAAALGGVDALVFTAGIGENSAPIRRRLCAASAWLGIELDDIANETNGPRISRPDSRVSAWVIPTNEELIIARHTAALLGLVEARV